ncbi:MAG TPA: hypothetical protein VFG09_03205 [Thermodesulfovibrionales bacterium]|nr:hypothetical protein [Thermodesulfovibrionales bacterium]
MKQKDFQTADLYLSAAICVLLGIVPNYKVESNRTLFVFPISNDLYGAMNSYNNGVALNAYEFAQMIKRLRAEMIMRREMGGGRG